MSTGYRYLRKVVTAKRLARKAEAVVNARLGALLALVGAVIDVTQFVDDLIERDIPVLVAWTLRRLGIMVLPSDVADLSMETITRLVSERTGIAFTDLTDIEKTESDIREEARRRVFVATGIDFGDLTEPNIKSAISGLIVNVAKRQAPAALKIAQLGIELQKVARDAHRDGSNDKLSKKWSEHLRRWNHREAQREYERQFTSKWVFVDIGKVSRRKFRGKFFVMWKRQVWAKKLQTMWKKNNKEWRKRIAGKPYRPALTASTTRDLLSPPTSWTNRGHLMSKGEWEAYKRQRKMGRRF